MHRIIHMMERLSNTRVIFKIAQPASEFIIGPSSTESLQDLLVLRDHAVNNSGARRRRRSLDILLALFFLITAPVGIWFVRNGTGLLRNLVNVFKGQCTWVGYFEPRNDPRIPKLPPGILNPVMADGIDPVPLNIRRANLEYAKDYQVWKDLKRVMRNYSGLGKGRKAWSGNG